MVVKTAERIDFENSRRTYLGASDAAGVCGLSPYNTALHVYLSKVGELPGDVTNPGMEWGNRLEEVIGLAYQDKTGHAIRRPDTPYTLHQGLPWMGARPDFIAHHDDGRDRNLEVKTAGDDSGWGQEGTDEIPDGYFIQTQHQMACMDVDMTDVAVLIRGSDFRIYTVERSDKLIDRLINIEGEFWEKHVMAHNPPAPDWKHPATLDLVRKLYGVEDGEAIVLGADAGETALRYLAAKATIKSITAEMEGHGAKLLYLMGSAAQAVVPGCLTMTRRMVKRAGYAVAPTEYITFRVKQNGGL